jgi:S1-C subfamily serine protease
MHDPNANRPQPAWSCSPVALFLLLVSLCLFAGTLLAPRVFSRMQEVDEAALVHAAYARRQGELKAEAEAASALLDKLDQKIVLTGLGFREVARKVAPAVVNISNEREVSPEQARRGRGRRGLFYDNGRLFAEIGQGSGILVKPGLVLTNNHVVQVQGAERLRVTFASGRWVAVDPSAVATDPLTDLAVLRLTDTGAKQDYDVTAEFADSDKVEIGDWAVAVGSPLGLRQTVTTGIISARGRVLERLDLVEMLQTDAAINPGNSGGPLFDLYGRVIGINVAIATETGGSQGLGFAIPSNTAKDIFTQLAENGEVVRGFLGANLQDVAPNDAARYGLGDTAGVLIANVVEGQPADEAGLRSGDVVVRLNGEALSAVNPNKDLRLRVTKTKPGTTVTLGIVRRGQEQDVSLTVGKRPRLP